MSPNGAPTTIATIGIDLGKNIFHLVGLESARRDCFATEALARPDRATAGKCAVLPDRHGGVLGRPPHRPPLDRAGPRCPANPSTIREAVPQRAQERLPRRRG